MSGLLDGKFIADIFKQEVPTGTVNGSNTVFNLSSVPQSDGCVCIYLNGLIKIQGTDYTISSATITFTTAPALGQKVYATYVRKKA